jgi:hypothetical protein
MVSHEEQLAIARSYEQIEKTLGFTDFRRWIHEEVVIREAELVTLELEKKFLFESKFMQWQAWKAIEVAIEQHLRLSKETLKENYDEHDGDPGVPSSSSSSYFPGY